MKRINKTLNIADIHFGSKNRQIGESLKGLFEDNDNFRDVNYIKLLGDVWHRQLLLGSDIAVESMNSLLTIGKYCIRHNIKLRALEGTSTHDRRQMRQFQDTVKEVMPDLDFIYIDKLCILQEEDHTCLYVPDNLNHGTVKTMELIRKMMKEMNITKIDTCSIHGPFKHSMGFGDDTTKHDEQEFLDIINSYIVAGHIHTFQIHDRIITPGSIDVISFGENIVKGVVVTYENYDSPNLNEFTFIENKRTMSFVTIPIEETILHLAFAKLTPIISKLRMDSEVCLVMEHTNPLFFTNEFEAHYPNVNITLKQDNVKQLMESDTFESSTFEHSIIDATNIGLLLEDKMETSNVPSPIVREVMDVFYRKLGNVNE